MVQDLIVLGTFLQNVLATQDGVVLMNHLLALQSLVIYSLRTRRYAATQVSGRNYLAHLSWVKEDDVEEKTQASAFIRYHRMTMSPVGIVRTKVIKFMILTPLVPPTLKKIIPNAAKI